MCGNSPHSERRSKIWVPAQQHRTDLFLFWATERKTIFSLWSCQEIEGNYRVEVMPLREDGDVIGREYPAKGVVLSSDMPLILWCTVRASERGAKWVAQAVVMKALLEIWREEATKWLVGDFVLMPDHVHFFCCPRMASEGVAVEKWTGFWKDRFSKRIGQPQWRWQDGLFHTRMRSDAHYRDRLDYLWQNPVDAGLVENAESWKWKERVWDLGEHIQLFGEPKKGKESVDGAEPE